MLGVWFLAGIFELDSMVTVAVVVAALVALAVAGYTAFLFAQAEGRDLWQSPLLLWHMLAGALVAGGGASLVAAGLLGPEGVGAESIDAFAGTMLIGALAVGALAIVELASKHPTRNAEEAFHHLTRGAFSAEWWSGLALSAVVPVVLGVAVLAGGTVWFGALGGVAGMVGIWLVDDAFVKAGQSVPLS